MGKFVRLLRLSLMFCTLLALLAGSVAVQAQGTPTPIASPSSSPVATPTFTKLDLNTVTDEQLLTVPGVGDKMLHEFLEYRPYTSIVQFRQEIGKYVSEEQVATYEESVYVPVDPNAADVETLKQLPGVDDTIAQALIDGRTYATNDDFLSALAMLVSASDAAAAAPYLAPQQ
jgi:DNA uptake protein ComE-like DNA-binding protein